MNATEALIDSGAQVRPSNVLEFLLPCHPVRLARVCGFRIPMGISRRNFSHFGLFAFSIAGGSQFSSLEWAALSSSGTTTRLNLPDQYCASTDPVSIQPNV